MAEPVKPVKPVKLVAKDVAIAALKAYDEGRLSAQGPTPECSYRDRAGLPCAIGAALDDATARRFDIRGSSSIGALIDGRQVKTRGRGSLRALQASHDAWAKARGADRAEDEAKFLATARRIAGVAQ